MKLQWKPLIQAEWNFGNINEGIISLFSKLYETKQFDYLDI